MEKVYYIYHIPGIKIGVCQNQELRIQKQQKFNHWEIIEEHTDIYLVSDREKELQRQYGYKVDKIPYWKIIENGCKTSERKSKASKENFAKAGLVGAKSKSKSKTDAGRKNFYIASQVAKSLIMTCQHCGLSTTKGNIVRWHGPNCKTIRESDRTENQNLLDPSYLDPYHL